MAWAPRSLAQSVKQIALYPALACEHASIGTAVDAGLDCIAQDSGQHVGRERLGLAGLPDEGATVGRLGRAVGRS